MGLPIKPMLSKKDTGFQQVGDYHVLINGKLATLVIERKGVTRNHSHMTGCDLYSTLFNKTNRDRFKKSMPGF